MWHVFKFAGLSRKRICGSTWTQLDAVCVGSFVLLPNDCSINGTVGFKTFVNIRIYRCLCRKEWHIEGISFRFPSFIPLNFRPNKVWRKKMSIIGFELHLRLKGDSCDNTHGLDLKRIIKDSSERCGITSARIFVRNNEEMSSISLNAIRMPLFFPSTHTMRIIYENLRHPHCRHDRNPPSSLTGRC